MKKLFVLPLLCWAATAQAQLSDSTIVLPEAGIRYVLKAPGDHGKSIRHLKPDPFQNTLGNLLNSSSAWTIKSYGPGTLASLSIRGSGAVHSPLLWNGLNIQNSMNGQQDLNLIPGFFFDEVELISGAKNDLSTGGILGGSLNLKSGLIQSNRILAGIDAGSFTTANLRVGFDLRKGNWSNRFRSQGQNARNDFPYPDPYSQTPQNKRMQNAALQGLALLNELHHTGKKGVNLRLAAWYQDYHREIPPTLLSPSTARQKDRTLRLNFTADYSDSLNYLQWNSGYFYEELFYRDPEKNLNGINLSNTLINQFQYRRKIRKLLLQTGVTHHYMQAVSNSYLGDLYSQQRLAFYAAISGSGKKLKWKADMRQEFSHIVPQPAWSAGLDYEITRSHRLSAHLTQVSRLPNLNDLYWNPGGNRDLLPEQGHSGEIAYAFHRVSDQQVIRFQVTAFYSIIENWILWLPEAGFWTSQNLQEVHSRGAEWELKILRKQGGVTGELDYGGSFTLSENQKAKSTNDESVGRQLIYVPYWKHFARLKLVYRSWELAYRQVFMGGRYTATDHSSFLPAYTTGDVELGWKREAGKQQFQLALGLQSVWNTYYESIVQRPMPGRYIQFTLNYQIKS